jgi:D-glycero-alpha-D-manno-heptose 1-phosphate guanylyltransferase
MPHRIFEPVKPQKIDVVILCGGLGTRLKKVVGDRPKAMAEINNRPFLDLLINHTAKFGFHRFILCTGYRADSIVHFYANKKNPYAIEISNETRPLGTGGALQNASGLIESDPFLVLNGDSFCAVNLIDFLSFHFRKKSLVSMCVSQSNQARDYGTIRLDADGRIVQFSEKTKQGKTACINAGIYLFGRKTLSLIPAGKKSSLEYDLFPTLTGKAFYGYVSENKVLDIGTPKRYEKAKRLLAKGF